MQGSYGLDYFNNSFMNTIKNRKSNNFDEDTSLNDIDWDREKRREVWDEELGNVCDNIFLAIIVITILSIIIMIINKLF